MSNNVIFRIGDVGISIEGETLDSDLKIPRSYRPFIRPGKPDIIVELCHGTPDIMCAKKVFECPPIWTLYRENGLSFIRIYDDLIQLKRTLVLSHHLARADLYLNGTTGRLPDPFYGPTFELLFVRYLAQVKGIIMHACGVAKNDKGYLFAGESGAGKSTLARMWAQESGVDILSDDRIILRRVGDHYWMHGTPWHGEGRFVSPRGAKLGKIFFLRHGQENRISIVDGTDTVSQLLACSFAPFWDLHGMACTLEFFDDLRRSIPCQELALRPGKNTLDFLRTITE